MIDDPDLRVRAHRHGDRLQANGDRIDVLEAVLVDPEDFQPVVRRVDREQVAAVGRQGEWADLTAFEQRE